MENLQALFTSSHKETFKGVEIEINDIKVGDLPYIVDLVESFVTTKGDTNSKIATILKSQMENVEILISRVTSIKKEDVSKLSIDALIFIVSKIITSNIVFIKKNILPMAEEIQKTMKQNGLT